ncbi:MAG: metal ABC transporter substrate-binding protein [Actinomycetota bacterium]
MALLLLAPACGGGSAAEGDERIEVVASFYPLAFVAGEVGGNLVDVDNLTPPGAEPHDLELTPGQVRALAEADLVVYLGDGFQHAVEDSIADLKGEVVDGLAGQDDLLEPSEQEETPFDPHIWLDPQRTAAIARLVGDRLAEIDPGNATTYRSNVERLGSRLDDLDTEYRDGLGGCERNSFVTSHEAFGYLASAYGLEQIGISGIDPEAEPSPQRLAEVADFVAENGVTTIFFEVLVSPDIAETLAEEAGIRTARLDPIEGPPEEGDYFTAMKANLEALREGLGCK